MEIWDLYNDEGAITNETIERGKQIPKGRYHLVVHLWLINEKGEFLIQKRSELVESKKGKWGVTGGSAQTGETSREAVIREVREEIGCKASEIKNMELVHRVFKSHYIIDIWVSKVTTSALTLKMGEEVSAIKWVDKKTLLSMDESDEWLGYEKYLLESVFAKMA